MSIKDGPTDDNDVITCIVCNNLVLDGHDYSRTDDNDYVHDDCQHDCNHTYDHGICSICGAYFEDVEYHADYDMPLTRAKRIRKLMDKTTLTPPTPQTLWDAILQSTERLNITDTDRALILAQLRDYLAQCFTTTLFKAPDPATEKLLEKLFDTCTAIIKPLAK